MSIIKKLIGQTAIYGIPSVLGRVLNFLLIYVHTGAFAPNGYGIVSEFYAYAALLMIILVYGMETTYFRFSQKREEKTLFSTLQTGLWVSSALFFLLVWLNASGISTAMGYPNQDNFVKWFVIILVADALAALPLARLRFKEKPLVFAGINLAAIFVNIGINLFVFLYWYPQHEAGNAFLLSDWFNPELGVAYVFIANVISSVAKFTMASLFGIPNPKLFNFTWWKESMKYAWPLVFVGFAGIINETFDRAAIKHLLTPIVGADEALTQLGIYSGCYKLSILVTIGVQAFRYAAEPLFFKQIKERSDATLIQIMNYLSGFLLLIFLVVSLFMDVFKEFINNPEYWDGLDIVPPLLLANCFLGMHIQLSMWFKLSDKNKYGAGIAIIASLITLVGNFALVPVLGFRGAAYTTLAVYIFLPTVSYFISKKHYFVAYDIKKISLFLTVSILMVAIGFYWKPDLHFAIKGAMVLGYMAVLYFSLRRPVKG